MAVKHGLGRGLDALIKEVPVEDIHAEPVPPQQGSNMVPIEKIRRNPRQPRKHFSADALTELTESIREMGVIQPLLVRRVGTEYELVAGERRFLAAREAGLKEVPVTVKEASDRESVELALVENLQREDLNAIEEAEGYQSLAEEFQLTQEDIAKRVGKARATVANAMRLLVLPEEIKRYIIEDKLSPGHAKALLGIVLDEEKCLLARRIVEESLSVRSLERIVERTQKGPRRSKIPKTDIPPEHLQYLSDKLLKHFGTQVRIIPCRTRANGKTVRGSVEIDFYTNDDLSRILDIMGLVEHE